MSFTCPACGQQGSCWSQVGRPIVVDEGTADLARGYNRYEYLRGLNVQQFRELFELNLKSGVAFDTLVDIAIADQQRASEQANEGER